MVSGPRGRGQYAGNRLSAMVRVNDVVLYGVDGICHATGVATGTTAGAPMEYYILRPVGPENTTIYVPVDNVALVGRMRRLLSLDEVIELIRSIPDEETIWIEDDLKRRAAYGAIIEGSDRREIVRLIKALYQRDRAMREGRRRMHAADERLMKEAEKRLYDEFAHVLNIEPGQVLPFIFSVIGEKPGA